jgi:hypothetical protein
MDEQSGRGHVLVPGVRVWPFWLRPDWRRWLSQKIVRTSGAGTSSSDFFVPMWSSRGSMRGRGRPAPGCKFDCLADGTSLFGGNETHKLDSKLLELVKRH